MIGVVGLAEFHLGERELFDRILTNIILGLNLLLNCILILVL